MKTIVKLVEEAFSQAIKTAFPNLSEGLVTNVAYCSNSKFGDYQCNNVMGIFAQIKGKPDAPKNPRAVAQAIIDSIPAELKGVFGKMDVAGPGFINIHLSPQFLSERVNFLLKNGVLPPEVPHKKVIIDFSSPNIAKEMHVGHLRSTIIGETLARTLEFVKYDVERVNHVGDWGTQFGMLISFLKEEYPDFLSSPPPISDLQAFYKRAKVKFDADEDFKKRAHMEVVKLQGGDEANLIAWKMICEISRNEFKKIYDRLDVHLDEVGESFYNPIIPNVIEELKEKKHAVESQGALCVFALPNRPPLMVQKSDGGYTYDSTDLAAIRYRLIERNADWVIYVVDSGQGQHFELLFEGAKIAGWWDPQTKRVDHVGFGVVLGEDNKKFKTRSGDTVRLVDLLDEARERSLKILKDRAQSDDLTEEEQLSAAEAIGYGAVKYADLKSNRLTNYKFSFDRMLDLNGNTAVYLLYAHARIASIVRKSGMDIEALKENAQVELVHPSELGLAKAILRFPEVVESVLQDLMPNKLCDFLYELSEYANDFFTNCRVIGTEQQASRLLLCEATAITMRKTFDLLAIRYLMRI